MPGVILTIFIIANGRPTIFLDNLALGALAGAIFICVFFILPVYGLISKTEIFIDKGVLTVKSYFLKEKEYALKDLIEWQLKEGYSRYGSTTHLLLLFSNQDKVNIQEKEMTNFDLLIKFFEFNFRRSKKVK